MVYYHNAQNKCTLCTNYFIEPRLHAKLQKKLMSRLRNVKMGGPTDGRTEKGHYHGPHRVNPGLKINLNVHHLFSY